MRRTAARAVLTGCCLLLGMASSQAQPTPAAATVDTAALQGDQTLEDLARKLFEDPTAADEIRTINGLAPGSQPGPGKPFKLPGKDRRPAVSALGMARQAVQEAKLQGAPEYAAAKFAKAEQSLAAAQHACRQAEYANCQRQADDTWALARLARKEGLAKRSAKNRFAVSVDDAGTTRVEVMEGDGIEVQANKRRTRLVPGQAVRVQAGKVAEPVRKLLPPPEQVLPFPGSRLVTASIHFHWKPVAGAARYVLLVSRDPAGRRPVRQLTTEGSTYLLRSRLADGEYYWFMRTVDVHGLVGRASQARAFSLAIDPSGGVTVEPGKAGSSPPAPGPDGDKTP